jgi:ankyrin repeat protein
MRSGCLLSPLLALFLMYTAAVTIAAADTDSSTNAVSKQLLDACLGPTEDVKLVQQILKDPAVDINVRDESSGQTCLMASVLRGKADLVRLLLAAGADATVAERDGYTPAHGAAFQGRTAVMKVLLEFGVGTQQEPHGDGYLPWHRACWGRTERHAEFVEYMLSAGLADVHDKDATHGKTCRDMTSNPGILEVLDKYEKRTNGGEF